MPTSTPDPSSDTSQRSFAPRRYTVLTLLLFAGIVLLVLTVQFLITGQFIAFRTALPSAIFIASASVLVAIAAAILIGAAMRVMRSNLACRLLVYIDQAVRLGVPLPEFLLLSARGEGRFVGERMARVARAMQSSTPLSTALRSNVPELPLRTTALLRAAEHNGTIGMTLARLVAERELTVDDIARRRVPWLYFAVLAVLIPLVASLHFVFVVPKWREIFRDFGLAPQWWMRDPRDHEGILMLMFAAPVAIGVIVILTFAARGVRSILLGQRDIDTAARPIWARAAWRMPIFGQVTRDRGHADVCQTLADGLSAVRPLDAVLADVVALRLNPVLRSRVRTWHDLVANGRPIGSAAREAGLPAMVADLLGDRPIATGAADAAAFLARHYRVRAERGREWLLALATPTITLVAGAIVAIIALAIVSAMQSLIGGLGGRSEWQWYFGV